MKSSKEYLNSGILELYVLGLTSEEENKEINQMVQIYPELNVELEAITQALVLKTELGVNPLPLSQ